MAVRSILIVTKAGEFRVNHGQLQTLAKSFGWKTLAEITDKRFPLLPRFDGAFGPYWQAAGLARYDSWEVHALLSMD